MSAIKIKNTVALLMISGLGLFSMMLESCSLTKEKNDKEVFLSEVPQASVYPTETDSCISWHLEKSENIDILAKEVDRIDVIPLQTTKETIIGSISKVKFIGDKIVVVDAGKAQRIFLFNTDGTFDRFIGSKGEGPGEYASINGISIDDDKITITDWHRNQMVSYNYQGECVSQISLTQTKPHNTLLLEDGSIIATYASYFPDSPYGLVWIKNDSIESTAFPFTNTRSFQAASIRETLDKEILYHQEGNDTIFRIEDGKIYPKFKLGLIKDGEFEKYLAATAELTDNDFDKHSQIDSSSFFQFISWVETPEEWIVSFTKQRETWIAFVSKEDNTARTYRKVNMAKREAYFPFVYYGNGDSSLVSWIEEFFVEMLSDRDKERIYAKLSDNSMGAFIENYDFENNNPLICRIWLK